MAAAVKITGFLGLNPRTSPRLIGETAAQVAQNVNITSGEIRPLAQPKLTYVPLKPDVKKTIYQAGGIWFTWVEDVDIDRSPLPGEVKWIYSGENEPRITTEVMAATGAGDNYPATCRALGLAKPQTAPTVTPTGGVLTDVTRYYTYTFWDDWNQESAPAPLSVMTTGKPDGTWAISGMDGTPPNNGNITALIYAAKSVTITSAIAHFNRAGETITIAGVTTVTDVNGTWKLDAVDPVAHTMTFTVTTTPTGTYNDTVDTTDTWERVAKFGACSKRLYRTSGSTSQFQLVAKDIVDPTYNDTLTDGQILGDELITANWEMPPVDLQGMMTLPSGAAAGFSGNEICFSEPFQPHAWPPDYRMRVRYPVVAIGQFTSGIVVGTTGEPSVIVGHEPGQMSMQPVPGAYPCLSKRSMVSLGDRVGYTTAHGYATIGDSGVDLLTKDWYTRDDWFLLVPSTMVAASVRGRVYLMTYGKGDAMLVIDYLDGTGLTSSDVTATELYADPLTGRLYLSDALNQDVREFDPTDGIYMTATWRSKEVVLPEPINFGAARINFASRYTRAQLAEQAAAYADTVAANEALLALGEIGGDVNADDLNVLAVNSSRLTDLAVLDVELQGVTFTVYADGTPVYSTTVTDTSGFRLPAGFLTDTYAFEVQSQSLVKSIDVAHSMQALKSA